jgi:hypothetical protein
MGDGDLLRERALDEAAVEVVEVLRDEDEGEVGLEEEGVVAPALEEDEGVPVLGGGGPGLGHGDEGLGVVEDHRDPPAVGDSEADVVLEEGEHADGVLRDLLRVVRPEEGVVPGEGAVEVGLPGARGELDPGGAVVEDDEVAAGEEVLREEVPERDVLPAGLVVLGGDEVADVPVEDELVEGLREVPPGEGLGPLGVVRDVGCMEARSGGSRKIAESRERMYFDVVNWRWLMVLCGLSRGPLCITVLT